MMQSGKMENKILKKQAKHKMSAHMQAVKEGVFPYKRWTARLELGSMAKLTRRETQSATVSQNL